MPLRRTCLLAALFLPLVDAGARGYPVGFDVVFAADSARPMLPTGRPRPVQIAVWYPAKESPSRDTLAFVDYLGLSASDSGMSDGRGVAVEVQQYRDFLESHGAPADAVDDWLSRRGRAVRRAPAARGRFPLVLIAPGNGGSVYDQAWLAEYLAAHGYAVAVCPSPMRISGPMREETEVGEKAAEQAGDLGFAVEVLARRAQVDASSIGVVGHSFGARGGLLLAMRDERVRALVSLDGGIGVATGSSSLEHTKGFSALGAKVPTLHFYETLDAYMAPDFSLLRRLTSSERWLVGPVGLHHHLFTVLGTDSTLGAATGSDSRSVRAYAGVMQATGEFLDAFVRDLPAARATVLGSPGWPAGLPTTHLPAATTPPIRARP
ncbi:MAG TPA: alpha/beta fold hydrolase [Gemmatimonadales bacterium]